MSAVREMDMAAGPLATGRRLNELLVGLDLALARIDALTLVNEVLSRALISMIEPEDVDTIRAALDLVAEPDPSVDRVREAAQRSRTHGQQALEDFILRSERARKQEPWIPIRGGTKRQPRGVVQIEGDRVWTQDPGDDGGSSDPLAGKF